jgi:hypothetical protein
MTRKRWNLLISIDWLASCSTHGEEPAMPDEVLLFGTSAVLFIAVATLVTTLLWRWNTPPLPSTLAPTILRRLERLFHA